MNARQLIAVNGAEWLHVESQARDAGRTVPQQVRALCGLTPPEREQLERDSRQAGTTLAQYIRTRCGFKPRNSSLPGTDEREDEEGLKPEDYFPPEA